MGRDAVLVVTAGVLGVGENSAPGCCGKRVSWGLLLGSLGFHRVAFPRDMKLSISRRGVPPYLRSLSFPLYATFVSVSSSFDFVLRPATAAHLCFLVFDFAFVFASAFVFVFVRYKNIPADCQTSVLVIVITP